MAAGATAVGSLAGGIGSITSGQSQADAMKSSSEKQYGLSKDQLDYTKKLDIANSKAQQQAYQDALKNMASGEEGIMASQAENPFLAQVTNDIRSGTQEDLTNTANQMRTNLATSGVRGGQSATLLNRGSGQIGIDAMKNINQLKYQDSATKQAQMNAYNQAKALLAQNKAVPGADIEGGVTQLNDQSRLDHLERVKANSGDQTLRDEIMKNSNIAQRDAELQKYGLNDPKKVALMDVQNAIKNKTRNIRG